MKIKVDIEQTKVTHEPYVQDEVQYEEGIIRFELSIKGLECPNGDRTKLNKVAYDLTEAIATTVMNYQKTINLGAEVLS
jgi:hypothetical protein